MHRNFFLLSFSLFMIIHCLGCSANNTNPINPPNPNSELTLPVYKTSLRDTNRTVLGVWTMDFDLGTSTVTVYPERNLCSHLNVTSLIPPPKVVIKKSGDPPDVVSAEVTIKNPYPVDAYDLRLIIYTDDIGHKLLNSDAWTNLFDIPQGMEINPFIAYAKSNPDRKITGISEYKQDVQVLLPGGNSKVLFAIDASYPAHCTEPYAIENFS
jgi:hypothetical protein